MPQDIKKTLADETHKLRHKILESGVDAIIGGFPCQDISVQGKGDGITASRSGLVREMVNTIRMVRPKIVLLENVAALLSRGMGTVLGLMANIGYDTEWDCIPASDFGAPHRRERVYILAYPCGSRGEGVWQKPFQRQPEFSWLEDVRRLEDLPQRCDLYESPLCGGGIRTTERLHAIGNGNPPCIIRELTKGLAESDKID